MPPTLSIRSDLAAARTDASGAALLVPHVRSPHLTCNRRPSAPLAWFR